MAGGVEFVDGQVNGAAGKPFESGSMSSGGPVQGPNVGENRSTTVPNDGERPPQGGSVISSPCDY